MVKTRGQHKRSMAATKKPSETRKRAKPTPKKPALTSAGSAAVEQFATRIPSSLFVWGENSFGQLGLGEAVMGKTRPCPLKIGHEEKVVDVAAGGMHTVVVTERGAVYSWGVNDEGALGRHTAGRAWDDSDVTIDDAGDSTVPGEVRLPASVGKVVGVSAGDDHTLLVTKEGTVWGFGSFRNGSGIVGFLPGVKNQLNPVKVYHPASPAKRALKVASGANHAAILVVDGTVFTWGDGDQGQLGRLGPRSFCGRRAVDRVNQMLVPQEVRISRGALLKDRVVDVACGHYCTFLLTEKRQVFVMGCNNYCQLGESKPSSVLIFHPHKPKNLQQKKFRYVSAGPHHTLGLTENGVLLSWGRSCYGRLGQSGVTVDGDEAVPVPCQVDGLDGQVIRGMGAGYATNGCFSEAFGELWTWGAQECSLLAKGDDKEDNLVPQQVKETEEFDAKRVIQVVFGGQHAACLAVDKTSN